MMFLADGAIAEEGRKKGKENVFDVRVFHAVISQVFILFVTRKSKNIHRRNGSKKIVRESVCVQLTTVAIIYIKSTNTIRPTLCFMLSCFLFIFIFSTGGSERQDFYTKLLFEDGPFFFLRVDDTQFD